MTFASLSGGRDSTAMVVKWLEEENNLDYIIFCDTGFEFPAMYEYIDKLEKYLLEKFNKKLTRLGDKDTFNKWCFIKPISRGENKGKLRGLPRTIGMSFCTRETKIVPTEKFIVSVSPNKFRNVGLVGFTYNEVVNGRVSNLSYATSKYPLYEWKMNEEECEEFLKKRSIANPLYKHFYRTGCFLCPKQSKNSLYNLYKYYPKEWQIMKEMESKAKKMGCVCQTFKPDKTILEYEKEFRLTPDPLFENDYIDFETCFCGK